MGIDVNELRHKRERRKDERLPSDRSESNLRVSHEGEPTWVSKEKGIEIDRALDGLRKELSRFDTGEGFFGGGKNDGVLSRKEILRGIKEISHGRISDHDLEFMKRVLPENGLAIEEFVKVAKGALEEADKNRDGFVDPKELPREMSKILSELPSR